MKTVDNLDPTDVEALLRAVPSDEASVRRACVSAITHLPLSADAWRALGPRVRELLAEAAPGTPERRELIHVAARVPLASVRAELRSIARSSADPDAAEVRRVLREPSVDDIQALLARVSGKPPDARAAEALAALPIETLDFDEQPLRTAAQSQDPNLGLWAALALARRSDFGPLERILADEAAHTDDLSGDPWSSYQRLAAVRPVPEPLKDYLLAWLDAHPERDRSPDLVAWALTGARDTEGHPTREEVAEPEGSFRVDVEIDGLDNVVLDQLFTDEGLAVDQVDAENWQFLTKSQATSVIVGTVFRIADRVGVREWHSVGNELVHLTRMLPSGVDLPVPELYRVHTTRLRPMIPDSQTAWVLARAHPRRLVAGFASTIPGLETEDVVDALEMLAQTGDYQRGAPAPVLGADPDDSSRPVTDEVIDDRPRARSAPPLSRSGRPVHDRQRETPPSTGPDSRPGDSVVTDGQIPVGASVFVGRDGGWGSTQIGVVAPSRLAWPHLVAPTAVVAGESFPVEVGLGEGRDRAVDGTGIIVVPSVDYALDVELLIDGFAVEDSRTFSLEVTEEDRFPKRTVHLVAIAKAGLAERRRIGVVYRIGTEMRGYAGREIVVKATAGQASAVAPPETALAPGAIDTSRFATAGAADLTLVIQLGAAADGSRLLWSAISPHMDIPVPAEAPVSDLGSSPEQFLQELVREASTTPDPLDLFASLHGRGKAEIASRMPASVRTALYQVAEKVAPRTATLLLLSQDPYVPWELAVFTPPLPGTPAGGSPFLGAQAAVGRWVLQPEPPPPIDPPRQVAVGKTALVTGIYEGVPGWKRLTSAEREVEKLAESWPEAQRVDANLPAVLKCIKGDPKADIIHFALHGEFSTEGAGQGLVLIGTVPGRPEQKVQVYFKPSHVDGGELPGQPFVFLNACQVGANRQVLGNYSGMASAFARIGAAGVVAPLWSVDDEVASEVAIEFYRATLEDGQTAAEALRATRAKVTAAAVEASDRHASCTRLAYQFFGHPNMRLATRGRLG